MISYGNQLAGKDDNGNTLIISSMTSLTMPSANITGDSNFGTILESKVCVPWCDLMAPSVQTIPRGLELYEVPDH